MSRKETIAVLLAATLLSGCAVRKMAVNKIGDAIASGGSTYEKDDDLELVGGALPFSLKLVESLLAESPRHRGLLLTACQGFSTYSYLYVQQDADALAARDIEGAEKMRMRARRLYLRANGYGYRGLDTIERGIGQRMTTDPRGALARITQRKHAGLLYWNAAALGLAISVSKNDAGMLARIPEVEALLDRALALDESWEGGSLHEFAVIFAGAKPGKTDYDAMEKHYRRALELAGGRGAGAHVAYAESFCIPKQDAACFRAALDKALAIDAYASEKSRLQVILAQKRARRLLEQMDDLILPAPAADTKEKQ